MIDLCIVSYNTKSKLQRLLTTLNPNRDDHSSVYSLLIADNGSTDGSKEWLCSGVGTVVSSATLFINENVGYATACNQLAAASKGDIIALLNSDIWFTVSDLIAIQQSFDENPDIAILGPKQRDEEGHITHGGIFGDEAHPSMRGWKNADPGDNMFRELEECLTVAGSAYFIRRSVWDELTKCTTYQEVHPEAEGAFLPTPHYYEETFCSYHARAHGYKVFYEGRVSIGHSWHASHPVGSPQDLMFHSSREIFREMCDAHSIDHD